MQTNQVIPAQAVEAAARAAYARTNPYSNWRLAIRPLRDRYLDEARAALEAAAPHMYRDWLNTNKQGEK